MIRKYYCLFLFYDMCVWKINWHQKSNLHRVEKEHLKNKFSGRWMGYGTHGRSCLAGVGGGMCHMADRV